MWQLFKRVYLDPNKTSDWGSHPILFKQDLCKNIFISKIMQGRSVKAASSFYSLMALYNMLLCAEG